MRLVGGLPLLQVVDGAREAAILEWEEARKTLKVTAKMFPK
jgi:hypothetical protein